jgi:uncharacterized protein
MNEKMKNYLGASIVVAVLALAVSLFSYALSYGDYVKSYGKSIQPSSFRSFSATGEGKVVAIPDVAQFTFSVITEGDKDIAGLQKKNVDLANKAIDFVKGNGVAAKDVKTEGYNLEPRYQYFNCNHPESSVTPCPPPEIVGYKITQTVLVKVRDFGKIGNILGGVVVNGANNVSGLSFTVDDPTDLQNQARAEAIAKAKVRAEAVAEAGGFKLGQLLGIDEGYNPYPPMYARAYDAVGMGGAETKSVPAPTIEPGSQEITVNVTLRYEIQ